ncbi:MAG: sulfite exporter TauE/SafE family protein [Vicinamibacteria bacterium]
MSPAGPLELAAAALAAVAAGAVNALAGGGTLITFPALTALGLPAVDANVTNTIAVAPGHLGATLAQRRDLAGQRRRLSRLVPAAALGGLAGGLLLLVTTERVFRHLVPWLILLASLLLAVQEPLRARVLRRLGRGGRVSHEALAALPTFAAAVYGGYFGAGLSVIVLAALGLLLEDTLTRLNAAKQAVGFAANTAAALLFLFSGHVHWTYAAVMAVGAVAGGALGGRLAGRVRPRTLRAVVVTVGVAVSLAYFARGRA